MTDPINPEHEPREERRKAPQPEGQARERRAAPQPAGEPRRRRESDRPQDDAGKALTLTAARLEAESPLLTKLSWPDGIPSQERLDEIVIASARMATTSAERPKDDSALNLSLFEYDDALRGAAILTDEERAEAEEKATLLQGVSDSLYRKVIDGRMQQLEVDRQELKELTIEQSAASIKAINVLAQLKYFEVLGSGEIRQLSGIRGWVSSIGWEAAIGPNANTESLIGEYYASVSRDLRELEEAEHARRKYLGKAVTERRVEELHSFSDVLEHMGAMTMEQFEAFLMAFWRFQGTPTAPFDLGLLNNKLKFETIERFKQMGLAGFSTDTGYALFNLVPLWRIFNGNKRGRFWLPQENPIAYAGLEGQVDPVPEGCVERIMDLMYEPHVGDTSADILSSVLYLPGYFASVPEAYGLRWARVERLVLQQPIQDIIRTLNKAYDQGIPGLERIETPRVDHKTGLFYLGDKIFGRVVREPEQWRRKYWKEQDEGEPEWTWKDTDSDWLNPRGEPREGDPEDDRFLIKFTEDLYLGDKDRPFPVLIFSKGGLGAFHPLPFARYRLVHEQAGPRQLIRATATQGKLLWKDFQTVGLKSALSDARQNYELAKRRLHDESVRESYELISQQEERVRVVAGRIEELQQRHDQLTHEEHLELLEIMVSLMGAEHGESEQHMRRVKDLVMKVAQNKHLLALYPELRTEHYRKVLAAGALLHDIGKILVPTKVLKHPGKFDTRKQAYLMQTHAAWGGVILKSHASPIIRAAYLIARQHHVKWISADKGYPNLEADEPNDIGALITAVCDVRDALIVKRLYQAAAKTDEEVFGILANDTDKGIFHPVATLALFEEAERDGRRLTPNEIKSKDIVLRQVARQFPSVL